MFQFLTDLKKCKKSNSITGMHRDLQTLGTKNSHMFDETISITPGALD